WEANGDLGSYLRESGVPGLQGVDSRALVRHLRSSGTMRAVLRLAGASGFDGSDLARLRAEASAVVDLSQKSLVDDVSLAGAIEVDHRQRSAACIALVDYGLKQNIARSLKRRGLDAVVVPWTASVNDIRRARVAGVVLS